MDSRVHVTGAMRLWWYTLYVIHNKEKSVSHLTDHQQVGHMQSCPLYRLVMYCFGLQSPPSHEIHNDVQNHNIKMNYCKSIGLG